MPSQKTADESPTSILKIMTSFPVPGGVLISPLQENLLCLKEKEIFSRKIKPVPFLKHGQTSSTLLAKESVSLVGKLSKKSKAPALSSDASGNKEDLPRGSLAPSKHKVVQQATFCVQDEFLTSSAKEKALSQGKKLHRSKSSKNAAGNSLASEVAPPAPNPNPGLTVDNWVCCDSCQKWRLLPYDTLPEHLPKKWLCSMINWLVYTGKEETWLEGNGKGRYQQWHDAVIKLPE
ncbi:uncharacterized protein [Euphorbia lathyris]|uniref:uncharacterized protein isoform X2 n=1 Tax=Euphorbia lathyris TaxID=212925 RepID=UPI0033131054